MIASKMSAFENLEKEKKEKLINFDNWNYSRNWYYFQRKKILKNQNDIE